MVKKLLTTLMLLSLANHANGTEDKIVANVNGKPIKESIIKERVEKFIEFSGFGGSKEFNYDNLDSEMKNEITKNIILGDIITDEATKARTKDQPSFQQALKYTENQLLQKVYLEKLVKDTITEDKIKAAYEKVAKEQSNIDEYKASHILVKTEKDAKDIKAKLDKGGDFTALAKEFSQDSNKDKGGDLGYFSKGQMVLPFEEATEKLKIGEISAPVKTDFGYHIIKLEDKRKAKALSYEEMHDKIYEELSSKFIQEYISKIEAQNKVEFL
jgi:peptidyl-prolyl cis-trans isomerase C